MSDTSELDKTRRYLRPVRATIISDDPDGVHLAVYEWLPMFDDWATGPALCGESMRQGPLPEGTKVTCAQCLEWQPKYERMLSPGYRPEDDDPDSLRARAEAAEALLHRYVEIAAVTHKYRIMGGHDSLGENLSCSGCALAEQARKHLEQYR
jgi:hypothetical protein